MDNRTLAGLLAATPAADLKITELAAELTLPNGGLDLDAAAAGSRKWSWPAPRPRDYAAATKRLLEAMKCNCGPAGTEQPGRKAPAASAVAAGAGRPAGLRRGLRLVRRHWRAASFPMRRKRCWQSRTWASGWNASPGSSRNATSPSTPPYLEFYVDEGEDPPFTWLRRGIPFQLVGFGYDGLHEMWDGYREGLSALALLAESPDSCYDGPDGLRTAWLEAAAERIPQETLERIPKGGIALETLTEAVGETEYQGAGQAAAWVRAETGNFFLDHNYDDGDYDGFSDPWEEEIIQEGTEEWRKADRLMDSVLKLADWLEGDLPGRFAEMLDSILPRIPEPTTQQEENDDDDNDVDRTEWSLPVQGRSAPGTPSGATGGCTARPSCSGASRLTAPGSGPSRRRDRQRVHPAPGLLLGPAARKRPLVEPGRNRPGGGAVAPAPGVAGGIATGGVPASPRLRLPMPGLVFVCSPGRAPWVYAALERPSNTGAAALPRPGLQRL